MCIFSRVWLLVTLWTVACQAPLFSGFSKQEYWSGLPFPSPVDLPDPGIERLSILHWQVDSLLLRPPGKEICSMCLKCLIFLHKILLSRAMDPLGTLQRFGGEVHIHLWMPVQGLPPLWTPPRSIRTSSFVFSQCLACIWKYLPQIIVCV